MNIVVLLPLRFFVGRGERMSKDQKELYVKFFEENPCMLTQRRNDLMLEPLWNKLTSLLNSVPQGAVKNVEEWKQVRFSMQIEKPLTNN